MAVSSDVFWELQQVSQMGDGAAAFKAQVLALDLGPWELSIFKAIWYDYGQVRNIEMLERNAYGFYREIAPDEARWHTERCFEQGWIQRLDEGFVQTRHAELETGGYLMVRGLIGDHERRNEDLSGLISFTVAGAELYLRFLEQTPDSDHWAITYCSDDETATDVYGTSIAQCEWAIWSEPEPIRRDPPVPIGRWCDRWWQRFESGFRMRCWFADHANP